MKIGSDQDKFLVVLICASAAVVKLSSSEENVNGTQALETEQKGWKERRQIISSDS